MRHAETMEELKEKFLQQFRQPDNKSDITYVLIIIGCLVAVLFGGANALSSYQEATRVQEEITNKEQFVETYNQKYALVQKESYHPVSEDQIDDVQSRLLFTARANNLELVSLKNMSLSEDAQKENGKVFEMFILGAWKDDVEFLQKFHSKDALLSIRYMRFDPDKDGKVKVTMEYKIYTK